MATQLSIQSKFLVKKNSILNNYSLVGTHIWWWGFECGIWLTLDWPPLYAMWSLSTKTPFWLLFKKPGIMKYQVRARLYHHLWVDPCKKCLKRITFIIINTITKLHLFARIENPFYVTWFPRLMPFFNERIAELNKGTRIHLGAW